MRTTGKTTAIAAAGALLAGVLVAASPTLADGIVAKIVNSPLNSAGLVRDGYTALNVYLQKPEAQGIEFFNPEIPGYGIPPGGMAGYQPAEATNATTPADVGRGAVHVAGQHVRLGPVGRGPRRAFCARWGGRSRRRGPMCFGAAADLSPDIPHFFTGSEGLLLPTGCVIGVGAPATGRRTSTAARRRT